MSLGNRYVLISPCRHEAEFMRQAIDKSAYDFVCKLNPDLLAPPRYFEILMQRMLDDTRVATCSGKSCIREGGELVFECHCDDTSLAELTPARPQ